MKKILLFSIVLLLQVALFAQNRAGILSEKFDGTSMPSGWSISGNGVSCWSISQSNKSGGDANELMLYWSPQFNGVSRVVSPAVDLSNCNEAVVSFKHYLDNYSGANSIGIATSSDNGTTWNDAWRQSYSNSGQYTVNESISTPDFGNSNVIFCLYFDGNSYNINNWYFDDIEVFTQENLDIKLVGLNMPNMLPQGDTEITFSVQNMGITTVQSIVANYVITSVDETLEAEETFEITLAPLGSANLSFETTALLIPGSYEATINIVSVNGETDDDLTNNTISKDLNIAMGSAQKIPMIEHFSSSTCGPCVSVNQAMVTLTANNPGKYTYTKYPMSWPGSGDPYNTNEAETRRTYYGVSAVPQTFLDGVDQGFAAVTQSALDAAYNTPSFANIRGAFNVSDNTINIIADFMSYVDMSNVKAFITVNEKTTTGNVGSNGETEFHHIMMKMLDGATGNDISINAGEYQRLEFSFNMSTTFMEDINDLEVSLWLQDFASKELFNSHFAYEYTDHCYPVQNLEISNNESTINVNWEAPEANNPTGYNVIVNGELVAENIAELSYSFDAENALYFIEVVAVYEDDKTSVGLVKGFNLTVDIIENQVNKFNIYPNPANNFVKIAGNNINNVSIYNCVGTLIDRFEINGDNIEINTAKYNNGMYFINIEHNNGENSTKKLVITH